MKDILVVIGPGAMGLAMARRLGAGRDLLVADLRPEAAQAAEEALRSSGFRARAATVDITSRESVQALAEEAAGLGPITGVVHAAGVSPSRVPAEVVLRVDLLGPALLLEEFRGAIAPGGAALVVSSQAGHRLPALTLEEDRALATTPADELLALPLLAPENVRDSLHAYQLAKRGTSLRVRAEAVRWGERGARVNAISPGIVNSPLSKAELEGEAGDGYRRMIEACPVGRSGTPEEVATVAALLMGPDGGFLTGSDILMDGGVTAAYFYGDLGAACP